MAKVLASWGLVPFNSALAGIIWRSLTVDLERGECSDSVSLQVGKQLLQAKSRLQASLCAWQLILGNFPSL